MSKLNSGIYRKYNVNYFYRDFVFLLISSTFPNGTKKYNK